MPRWQLFVLGFLLPAYTISGFDASAHAAEETVAAARSVPRGIVGSVLASGLAGWIMLGAMVLAIPDMDRAANQGKFVFYWMLEEVLPAWQRLTLCSRHPRGPVSVRAGDGDSRLADGVRLCPRRRLALLRFAASYQPNPSHAGQHFIWTVAARRGAVHRFHSRLRNDHRGLHDLSLRFLYRAHRPGICRLPPLVDAHGAMAAWRLVSAIGG